MMNYILVFQFKQASASHEGTFQRNPETNDSFPSNKAFFVRDATVPGHLFRAKTD